jgi:hypothetical protein
MYGTYCRLGVHIYATPREVIKAASRRLKPHARYSQTYRKSRHKFYRDMLRYHAHDQDMARHFRL